MRMNMDLLQNMELSEIGENEFTFMANTKNLSPKENEK